MINRKILASFLVIAVVGAVAGSGTLAYFNDTEESTGNTFTAGAVDLKIDWTESYNNPELVGGTVGDGNIIEQQELTDNPGPVFNFNDVKPGDQGEATLSFHIDNNPSWLWMSTDMPENAENDCTEPEGDVDSSCDDPGDGQGELADHINVKLWYDDGAGDAKQGDNVHQPSEEVILGEVCTDDTGGDRQSLDVALTLDSSGSMDSGMQEAQDGAKLLVDELLAGDQSAAVDFDSDATLEQNLTTNKTAVKNAIDGMSEGGSTDMAGGISTARTELTSARATNDEQILVLLSDGAPDDESAAETAAQNAKDDGIRVITIAYTDGADEALMEDLASSPDDAYVAGEDDLEDVFGQISEDIGDCETATLADLHNQMQDGQLLDGDTSDDDPSAFSGSETQYIGFKWWIPEETGNVIQTDSVMFDMNFYAEQRRNNDNPQNPWAST